MYVYCQKEVFFVKQLGRSVGRRDLNVIVKKGMQGKSLLCRIVNNASRMHAKEKTLEKCVTTLECISYDVKDVTVIEHINSILHTVKSANINCIRINQ